MFVRAYKADKGDTFVLSENSIYGTPKVGNKLYTNICSGKLFTYGESKDECAIVVSKISFKENFSLFITILKGALKNLFTKHYKVEWVKEQLGT